MAASFHTGSYHPGVHGATILDRNRVLSGSQAAMNTFPRLDSRPAAGQLSRPINAR